MRIAYIGAERVGLACLQRLISDGKQVVGVFTASDELRPRIADFASFDDDVHALQIPYVKIRSSRSPAFIKRLKALHPDLVLVISWSQLIPHDVIEMAPLGCVGMHYSLLPQRRGGAPLAWALIDGLTESGITLFYMDRGIDTGDIIAQKAFEIGPQDTAKTLLDRILALAPDLLAESLDRIEQGTAPRIAQDETRATSTRRRRPADSRISRVQSPEALYNFIRALVPPYPPAFLRVSGRRLVIPSARLENGTLWIEGYLE